MSPEKPAAAPAAPVGQLTRLDEAIAFLEAGAQWAQLLPAPGAAEAAAISGKILHLIEVAVRAHEAVNREPLDVSKLHQLSHV